MYIDNLEIQKRIDKAIRGFIFITLGGMAILISVIENIPIIYCLLVMLILFRYLCW